MISLVVAGYRSSELVLFHTDVTRQQITAKCCFFLYPKTLQRIINCRWTELEMLNIFSDNTCILTNNLISGRKKKKKEH